MSHGSDDPPKIAVFSGPTATIQNSPPLVTSNKSRVASGLPPMLPSGSQTQHFDGLRAQRLAAPVTVYVEQYSAHPLEADAADLYGPPDGWVDAAGVFHSEAVAAGKPVYKVLLEPADGLYLLPYMARQADGEPWDDATAFPGAPQERSRQTFYPDASRIYEEINRFGLGFDGANNLLSSQAQFDFYRPIPSSGYTKGLAPSTATDELIESPPERAGEDFFVYFPPHLRTEPTTANLARGTNMVARALASGDYLGAQWLEGSPTVEESLYWLDLLIDTRMPIVGHASQRPHNTLSGDGDHNILSGVDYIVSRVWADADGANRVGSVVIVDQVAYSAREVAKTDARPGNYEAVGGHGGIVASFGGGGGTNRPRLTFIPVRKHTYLSEVNLTRLPTSTTGVRQGNGRITPITVPIKSESGDLIPDGMPRVTFEKYARYQSVAANGDDEFSVAATIATNLAHFPLAGFVAEGMSPYGSMAPAVDKALMVAVFSGMPVVRVGRGNTGGDTPRRDLLAISGSNLSATKARLLLMACLLRYGALPPAADPQNPSDLEIDATLAQLAKYQQIFDTH
jgi:L-asparaginase